MFESFVTAEVYKIVKNNTKGYCLFNKRNGTCASLQSNMYFINTAAKVIKQRVKNIPHFLLVAHSACPICPKYSLIAMIYIKMQTVAALHNDLDLHWFHTNTKCKVIFFNINFMFFPGMK